VELLQAGLGRHPEDVLVPIFGVGMRLGLEGVVTLLKGVGDVLEEEEAKKKMVLAAPHATHRPAPRSRTLRMTVWLAMTAPPPQAISHTSTEKTNQ
jgi:hypothetical protein